MIVTHMFTKKSIALASLSLVTIGVIAIYLATTQSPSGPTSPIPTAAQQSDEHSLPAPASQVASQAQPQAAPALSAGSKAVANAARSTTGGSAANTVGAATRATVENSELSTPAPAGEQTIATVNNAGVQRTLTPNEIGHFPRVYINANQAVPVEVSYPDGQPDDPVVIQVEDGGNLDGSLAAKLGKLDSLKKIAFKFTANADLGVYRVVLRKGADLRVLDFWVGDEQPMAQR